MLDENISWRNIFAQLKNIGLAKNIGLLYCAKPLLEQKPLKSIYFADIIHT